MLVKVPKRNWNGRAGDLRSTLRTWEWRWKLPGSETEVVLDFSEVQFLEPWALALFTAYGLGMKQEGASLRVHLDAGNPCNVYLEQMGLREVLATGKSITAWDEFDAEYGAAHHPRPSGRAALSTERGAVGRRSRRICHKRA